MTVPPDPLATPLNEPTEQQLIPEILTQLRLVIANIILTNMQVAERTGTNPMDNQIIHLIQLHGPLTAGRIATETGLTTGAVTAALNRLEQRGFAQRGRDPNDRRKVIVSLDEDTIQRVLIPHYANQADLMLRLLARYTPEQLMLILDFLRGMRPPGETVAPDRAATTDR